MGAALLPVKVALVDTVLPAVLGAGWQVTWGAPLGPYLGADVAAVLGGTSEVAAPAQSGLRTEEETLDVVVRFSCYRDGGPEAQRAATVQAFAGLDALRARLKTPGQETLAGTATAARVTRYELAEDDDEGTDDDPATGRLSQITATIRVRART